MSERHIPPAKDKSLFTPGPLTTSLSVKQAMLRDAGSWHFEFNEVVRKIRETLLEIAGVNREAGFESVLMQGSGTFGVESVLGSVVPPVGKLLVLSNGAYGERMVQMAKLLRIETAVLRTPEDETPDLDACRRLLREDTSISHVAVVHCETTTGILNPVEAIGQIVREENRSYIVDAMSSFGAVPLNAAETAIDFLVSSANKCLEGVPGFSFVIARRKALEMTEGYARSLSLDLLSQWRGFERNGQFRFTPPTHSILAFDQALREFGLEGGVAARAARYRRNHEVLMEGMQRLGIKSCLKSAVQSYIITSFFYPRHPGFQFQEFYRGLSNRGMIIYPGKLTQVDCFRIGTIGRIFEEDIHQLLGAIERTLTDMGVVAA